MEKSGSRAGKGAVLVLSLVAAMTVAPHLTYAAERVVLGEYINGTW